MIDVILIYRHNCPFCQQIYNIVREICSELGIPFRVVEKSLTDLYIYTRFVKTEVIDIDKGSKHGFANLSVISELAPVLIVRLYDFRGGCMNYVITGGTTDPQKYRTQLFYILHNVLTGLRNLVKSLI